MTTSIERTPERRRGSVLRFFLALTATAVGTATLGVPSAHAGAKQTAAVVVNTGSRIASGALGTARSSSGTKQMIGCWGLALQNSTPGTYSAYCIAVDAAGVTGSCTLGDLMSNGAQWAVLQTIKEDSYVSFSWTTTGVCTDLRVENYSYWEPLSP